MNSNELFYMLIALGGATVVGALGMLALAWMIDIQNHFHKWLLALLYPIIILAISVGSILSNRNVAYSELQGFSALVDTAAITWFYRLTTALILGICLARLISASQRLDGRGKDGRMLFLGFVFFYFSNLVLNNIFGENPVFFERFLASVIVIATVYFSRNQDSYYSLQGAKWGLFSFLAASFIAVFVVPHIAVQLDYDGYVPGIDIRLWGLASNPNSIGPLSLVFLLLITHSPFKRRWIQYLAVIMGVSTLLLAQSKTAWVAALVAFGLLQWHKMTVERTASRRPSQVQYSLRHFAVPILLSFVGLLLVIGLALFSNYENQLMAIAQEQQLTTLTGRTEIWSIAIETWKNNPLFGYGSNAWNAAFRSSVGMDAAVSAHSQYLQSLSEAGIIGFLGLTIYISLLWRCAYVANRQTNGLSLALFSIILVRSFTETPLDVATIFNGDFLTHLLLFRLVVSRSRKPEVVAYPQGQQQYQWG
jgi:O-antigen ligase